MFAVGLGGFPLTNTLNNFLNVFLDVAGSYTDGDVLRVGSLTGGYLVEVGAVADTPLASRPLCRGERTTLAVFTAEPAGTIDKPTPPQRLFSALIIIVLEAWGRPLPAAIEGLCRVVAFGGYSRFHECAGHLQAKRELYRGR
jgi:hypothetical protein